MKKNKMKRMNQKLFCLFPIIILFSTWFTPSFSYFEPQNNQGRFFSDTLLDHVHNKHDGVASIWPLSYHHDNEDIGSSILIDNNHNIIITGYTFNYSDYVSDFLTVKYDAAGNLLWAQVFDGGFFDYSWDATVDSQGNIIILGFNSTIEDDAEDLDITLFLIKYDSQGILQWNKTLTFENDCFPGGVAVDSKDNIILTMGTGNLDTIEFFCQTYKYDPQGDEIWNTTFTQEMLSFGSEVAVNDQDGIIICGLYASFFGQGWFSLQYDEIGDLQWVQTYSVGNQPYDLELDSNGNIILTGQDYSHETNSSSWLTLKCDPNGNVLWDYLYDGPYNEYPRDLTTDSQGTIYTVGSMSRNNVSRTCVIQLNANGEEQCIKFQSSNEAFLCIAHDNEDQLIGAGVINATTGDTFNSDFYVDIISDFTPPGFTVDHPIPGYIYLFDRPLFPLGKNALIIGPVTMSIDADDPDEISHVEFYINGAMVETKEQPPFEYVWDESGFGSYSIEAHVYDIDFNMKRDVQSVWKLL